jgi:hypothetical protein
MKGNSASATRLLAIGFRAALAAQTGDRAEANLQPLDVDTMVSDFHLDPDIRMYVMCSACSALYPFKKDSPQIRCDSPYLHPPNVCGADLYHDVVVKGKTHRVPILKFAHHPLYAWLARMLSRPDIEPYLEKYKLRQPPEGGTTGEMRDIWDSPAWWDFLRTYMPNTSDGESAVDNETLRLLFGLSMDGFNPFFLKAAKQVSY